MRTSTHDTLFDADLHESLDGNEWDERVVFAGIAEIVRDTLDAARDGVWHLHPDDAHDPERDPSHATCTYFGASGVLLALDWLHRHLDTPAPDELDARSTRIRLLHAAEPELESGHPSYLLGTSGIETTIALLTDSPLDAALGELERAIRNPTHDPLTGAGNALDALASLRIRRPADAPRIEQLIRLGAELELDALEPGPAGAEMWHVDLYGTPEWLTGAGHGAAGTLQPLLRSLDLLEPAQRTRVLDVTRALVAATASREGELANWQPGPSSWRMPVQWCHGAPGMILACAPAAIDHPPTLELLVAGGDLTWRAGPLRKGPTICHGTAGNALALLRLFELTRDELWLERARRMAMHALAQVRARRDELATGRYSLFTGDLGVACVLALCIQQRAAIVGLDEL